MSSSNGNIFRVTGPLWGLSTVHRWILITKVSDANFDVFLDLRMNKRLSKHSRRRWFETPLRSVRLHCDIYVLFDKYVRPSYKNSEYDASYHRLSIMFDLKYKYRVYASTNCVIALYRAMAL